MDQDRHIKVNWGVFNMPTIGGMALIVGAIWNLSGTMQRQDSRLGNIEDSRTIAQTQLQARLAVIEVAIAKLPNLEYRITVNEAAIVATNARIDRVTDALGSLRDDIAGVKTSIEVLTEQLKASVPMKRSDLEGIPPQLTRN